ncbi:MAG TPA: DUF4328 domain-containing protein [Pyrinomonadaceae bacterium]|nr:DUF4328 domain-containing protein [Pyrinomonadaceae bacterium]
MKILLIAGAVATGISSAAEAISLAFPLTDDQEVGDNPIGIALVLIIFLLALVELAIYSATVVFFLMWLYRAHDNLRAFNPWVRTDHSRGWAIGSFFVPFVNLVIPYRAVKEVWQKSGPPDEAFLAEPGPPAFFPAWWVFWLFASITSNISMRLAFNENVPESTATIVSIVAGVLFIVAAVFAYLVVDAIDKRQEETSEKLRLGKLSGPPPPPTNLSMSGIAVATPVSE